MSNYRTSGAVTIPGLQTLRKATSYVVRSRSRSRSSSGSTTSSEERTEGNLEDFLDMTHYRPWHSRSSSATLDDYGSDTSGISWRFANQGKQKHSNSIVGNRKLTRNRTIHGTAKH
jgi:hypothetical protein